MPLPFLAAGALKILAPMILAEAPRLLGALTGSGAVERVGRQALDAFGAAAGFPISDEESARRAAGLLESEPERRGHAAGRLREIEADYLADLADARARDLEVRRMAGGANRRADALLLAVVALLVACLGAMVMIGVFVEVETPHLAAATGLLGTAAGFLLRGLSSALDFEFGSSRGSKAKDEQLGALAAARPAALPPGGPEPFVPRGMAPVEEPGDRPGLRP